LEAYRFLAEGKNAASLKQIRATLSFAYKHWDLKNPFAKIEPPLHRGPQIRYLLLVKGKGSVFQDLPVPERLSADLREWKALQEKYKGRRILRPGGIAFAGSQFVFAGYSGSPFSNRAFNLRLRSGWGRFTAHGLRHSAATILLNHVGKDLREIQELLRHKNIRTTVRYTHFGYEQTRQTAEALSRAFPSTTACTIRVE
jgi:integrase